MLARAFKFAFSPLPSRSLKPNPSHFLESYLIYSVIPHLTQVTHDVRQTLLEDAARRHTPE